MKKSCLPFSKLRNSIFWNIFLSSFCILHSFSFIYAQQEKGLSAGLYVGAFFANNNTATLYDGYGYDMDGNKNNFENSYMKRRINFDHGGGNGQLDIIAQELGLNSHEWERIEKDDMPTNMRYATAFSIGLHSRYNVNNKSALLFNFSSMRMSATGNFTIEVTPSVNPSGVNLPPENIITFPILGTEQRFVFQTGLQQFLTDNEIFNFFVEAGPMLNMVKFARNRVIINTLEIDLTRQFDAFGIEIPSSRNMTAVDFGFFAGVGINLNTNTDWIVQMVYNPSFERIGIGEKPGPYLQNSIGLRMYREKWEKSKDE